MSEKIQLITLHQCVDIKDGETKSMLWVWSFKCKGNTPLLKHLRSDYRTSKAMGSIRSSHYMGVLQSWICTTRGSHTTLSTFGHKNPHKQWHGKSEWSSCSVTAQAAGEVKRFSWHHSWKQIANQWAMPSLSPVLSGIFGVYVQSDADLASIIPYWA